jgi:hypothetical protein
MTFAAIRFAWIKLQCRGRKTCPMCGWRFGSGNLVPLWRLPLGPANALLPQR